MYSLSFSKRVFFWPFDNRKLWILKPWIFQISFVTPLWTPTGTKGINISLFIQNSITSNYNSHLSDSAQVASLMSIAALSQRSHKPVDPTRQRRLAFDHYMVFESVTWIIRYIFFTRSPFLSEYIWKLACQSKRVLKGPYDCSDPKILSN